jgi:hypothetical protein
VGWGRLQVSAFWYLRNFGCMIVFTHKRRSRGRRRGAKVTWEEDHHAASAYPPREIPSSWKKNRRWSQ